MTQNLILLFYFRFKTSALRQNALFWADASFSSENNFFCAEKSFIRRDLFWAEISFFEPKLLFWAKTLFLSRKVLLWHEFFKQKLPFFSLDPCFLTNFFEPKFTFNLTLFFWWMVFLCRNLFFDPKLLLDRNFFLTRNFF